MQDAKNITFYPSENAPHISGRAVEILALTAQGLKSPQIADIMCRSVPTIRFHQVEARKFYHARCLTEAVAKAIALGDIQFRIDSVTEKTPAHSRFAALGFITLALFTTAIDTPYAFDADLDLARHHTTRATRTVKVRGNRREQTDFIIG